METLNSRERRKSLHGTKLTKNLIGTPFNFNHVQGVYKDSPEQFIIEGVHDLHSLEILQNNLLRANRHKENSNGLAQLAANAAHNHHRSLQEERGDGEGSGSGESDLDFIMADAILDANLNGNGHNNNNNNKGHGTGLGGNGGGQPTKPLRRRVLQGPHHRRRKSTPASEAGTGPTHPASGTMSNSRTGSRHDSVLSGHAIDTNECNRPSSPDIELDDPAFFDSLLSDNGSPRSEPCFSFIFDPPYSPPPPSFWSLPNSAFSRGGKRQGSTDSYMTSTSSTPNSDSPSDSIYGRSGRIGSGGGGVVVVGGGGCIPLSSRETRASSLSLSSSTTRHSSEDDELLLASAGSTTDSNSTSSASSNMNGSNSNRNVGYVQSGGGVGGRYNNNSNNNNNNSSNNNNNHSNNINISSNNNNNNNNNNNKYNYVNGGGGRISRNRVTPSTSQQQQPPVTSHLLLASSYSRSPMMMTMTTTTTTTAGKPPTSAPPLPPPHGTLAPARLSGGGGVGGHAPSIGPRSATTMGLSGSHHYQNHQRSATLASGLAPAKNAPPSTTTASMAHHFAKCTPRITKV